MFLFRAGDSPLSSLQERLCSPGSTARRALFTSDTAARPGGGATTPTRSFVPIAPKPTQGTVTITPLKSNIAKDLSQILKVLSPQKESNLPRPQATKTVGAQSDATTSSPTSSRQDSSVHSSAAATTPLKLVPSVSIKILPSPPKTSTLSAPAAELISCTSVSPSQSSAGDLLSAGGLNRPDIPTSPPIPSATVTPSPHHSQLHTPSSQLATPRTPVSHAKPKRTGSLTLFYRKMYQLAFIRMKDLCERLEMTNEFVQK